MSTEQLDLAFSKPRRPKAGADTLIALLKGKGWISQQQLCKLTGWGKRTVRAVASASDHIISAPGSTGYKLLAEATQHEYHRYRSARRNQAREMLGKIIRTDRQFYGRTRIEMP
ncbi:MAG: hypothetical protein WC661_22155 [Opitutaceae bacterium]|jgi:hypothetical protein